MGKPEHEVFACLFLDTKHNVIAYETLFYGTVDGASVYPRQVVKRALANNAAACIIAHNHPSGDPEPSHADKALTKRLKRGTSLDRRTHPGSHGRWSHDLLLCRK